MASNAERVGVESIVADVLAVESAINTGCVFYRQLLGEIDRWTVLLPFFAPEGGEGVRE
jgi:hypothetical protein